MSITISECGAHTGNLSSTAMDENKLRDSQRNPAAGRIESDRRLVEAIERVLFATTHPALRSIQIAIERGIVTLRGHVGSCHQKQLAQAMVQQVDGVRGIANGIEVVCCRRPGFGRSPLTSTIRNGLGKGSM